MCKQSNQGVNTRWEAGETGCAQLILGLQRALTGVEAGQLLEAVATNAGAVIDIPAWCRITGHELVSGEHPVYIIRKKGD